MGLWDIPGSILGNLAKGDLEGAWEAGEEAWDEYGYGGSAYGKDPKEQSVTFGSGEIKQGATAEEAAQYAWEQSQGVDKNMRDIAAGVQENYLGPALQAAEYGAAAAGFGGSGRVQTATDKARRMAMDQEAKLKFQREKETAMISNMWLDQMHKQGTLTWDQTKTQAEFMTQFWETLEMEAPEKMHKMTLYQDAFEACMKKGGNEAKCLLPAIRKALAE